MTTLQRGTFYSFNAYGECQSMPDIAEKGVDVRQLEDSVRSYFRNGGFEVADGQAGIRTDITENIVGADVLCSVMQVTTPGDRDWQSSDVDALFIGALNAPCLAADVPVRGIFVPHVPGVWAILSVVAMHTPPYGSVVTQTIGTRPTTRHPSASASVIGRATSQQNTVRSTDPARDDQTRLVNNGRDAFQLPPVATIVLTIALLLAGGVAVAYTVRAFK